MEAALHVAAGVCVEMPRVLRHPKRGFQSLTRDLKAMFRLLLAGYKRPARQSYRTQVAVDSNSHRSRWPWARRDSQKRKETGRYRRVRIVGKRWCWSTHAVRWTISRRRVAVE